MDVVNLIIHILAGILGGHAAAIAVRDHSFGALGHTIAGAAGGAFSGIFLQGLVVAIESDFFREPTAAELAVGQGLAGAVAGGIAMLIVGLIRRARHEDKNR